MRSDALNLHVYPVRMEMTATKHIPASHVFSTDNSKLKDLLFDETLLQICFTDKYKPKASS